MTDETPTTEARLRWFREDPDTNRYRWLPAQLFYEIDARGYASREVGLDAEGWLVHRMPDKRFRPGKRGFIDCDPIRPGEPGFAEYVSIAKHEFEEAWQRPIRPTRVAKLKLKLASVREWRSPTSRTP
jgi:hypothetical protein